MEKGMRWEMDTRYKILLEIDNAVIANTLGSTKVS